MKRAPGLVERAGKLRRVGFARERERIERHAVESRAQLIALRGGDLAEDSAGSATARLDEAVEHLRRACPDSNASRAIGRTFSMSRHCRPYAAARRC